MRGDFDLNLRERRQSFRANVVALSVLGAAPREIAERLGVSIFAVQAVSRPTRGTKKLIQGPRKAVAPADSACEVPHWVPDDLVARYQDLAAKRGEEFAASVVRRLKAEARP